MDDNGNTPLHLAIRFIPSHVRPIMEAAKQEMTSEEFMGFINNPTSPKYYELYEMHHNSAYSSTCSMEP